MLKNNLQSKTEILIIGGASKIARQAFKKNNEYTLDKIEFHHKMKKTSLFCFNKIKLNFIHI